METAVSHLPRIPDRSWPATSSSGLKFSIGLGLFVCEVLNVPTGEVKTVLNSVRVADVGGPVNKLPLFVEQIRGWTRRQKPSSGGEHHRVGHTSTLKPSLAYDRSLLPRLKIFNGVEVLWWSSG